MRSLDGSSLRQVDLGSGCRVGGGKFGKDLSEEPVVGVEPAALEFVVAPGVLPSPPPFCWSASRIRPR
jgi:hypothetical protein